jgi:hypothetical protein
MHDDDRPYHASGQAGHEKLRWLRALVDDNVTLAAAYHAIHREHFEGRAAASIVEALMLGLRERGVAALKEAPVQQRLAALSESQLHEVCERLQKLKTEIARPWAPDEVRQLLEMWIGPYGRQNP